MCAVNITHEDLALKFHVVKFPVVKCSTAKFYRTASLALTHSLQIHYASG